MEYFTGKGRLDFVKAITELFYTEFPQTLLYYRTFFNQFWYKRIDKNNFWIDLFLGIIQLDLPIENKSFEEIEQIIQKIFVLNDQYLKLEINKEARKQMIQFISFLICYFNSKDISNLSNKIQIDQLNSFPSNSFFGIWAMEIAHSLKITDGWEESIIKENSALVEETIKRYYLRREAYYEDILECQGQD